MHRLLGLHSVFDSRPNVGISCSAFSFFLFLVFLLQINIFWGGKKAKMTAKSRPVLRIPFLKLTASLPLKLYKRTSFITLYLIYCETSDVSYVMSLLQSREMSQIG